MNKVILMGRLTRDPEVRYSGSPEPLAIARYTLAVNRTFKREGQPDADFIGCAAIGKRGEFAEKYFKKGQMVAVCGRLEISNYEDKNGQKRTWTEVVVEDQYFAESKQAFESRMSAGGGDSYGGGNYGGGNYGGSSYGGGQGNSKAEPEGFMPIEESVDDDDLPF